MTKLNMKIRVRDSDHCREIQDALFKLGYGWNGITKDYRYVNCDSIYAHSIGNLTQDSSQDDQFFQDHRYKEYELKDGEFIVVKEQPKAILLPREEHRAIRFKDVVDAIYRLGVNGQKVPQEWIQELQELNQHL